MKKHKRKFIFLIISLFLFSTIIVGCGGSAKTATDSYSVNKSNSISNSANSGTGMALADAAKPQGTASASDKKADASSASNTMGGTTASQAGNKIILSGSIQMETLKYEDTVKAISDYVSSIGGYSENSTIQGSGITSGDTVPLRHASFVFRIPKDNFTGFFTGVKGFGTITSQQMSGKDVTETYTDTTAKVNALKVEEQRLLDLTKQAGQLSDVLQLEKEIANVRQQIDSLTTQLKTMDNQVTYSTVSVNVQEVDQPKSVAPAKSKGLFQRMGYNFTESMKNLWTVTQDCLVFIVTVFPFLVAIGILVVIVFYIRRGVRKLKGKYKK